MRLKASICFLFISSSLFSNNIYDFIQKGDSSLFYQDYYSAIEYYKEAIDINKNDVKANKGLSDAFFMLGEYEESLIYIDICISLDKSGLEYRNTRGRILTALGRYDEALIEYETVLKKEMYNIGAKSGMAELRIVAGDLKGSLYDFEKILKLSPDSRRLLLSLVVLYDSQKEYESADDLIQKAIRYYPNDPIVLEGAARHYMETKNYSGASIYMDELLTVSNNTEILLLNAELLICLGEFDDALSIITEYMKVEKDNPDAYYIATLILDLTDKKDQALSLIKRGLDIKPDEELYRFYSELIMNDLYLLKDVKRNDYSSWYLEQGALLEGRYYYEKAKNYYLRGLDLDPFSVDLRISYANILNKMGLKHKYLEELELVLEQNPELDDVKETLLIEQSLPEDPIYTKWGDIDSSKDSPFTLSVFLNSNNDEVHLFSSKIFKDITSRFLSGTNKYSLEDVTLYSGKYSESFNKARESDCDFFIILDYFEGSRTFSLKATIYLTKSGRPIKTFSYLKTGNNRIFNSFENLSKDIENFFPIIGTVTKIKGNELLINLGEGENITQDMNLDVVKKNSIELIPNKPYVNFNKERHLGQIKINVVGESSSEGVFTANSSFNLLNIGDSVLFMNEEAETEEEIVDKTITDKELIEQLLQVN